MLMSFFDICMNKTYSCVCAGDKRDNSVFWQFFKKSCITINKEQRKKQPNTDKKMMYDTADKTAEIRHNK